MWPSFLGGFSDAVVTRVASDGQALVFSTYIGGGGRDSGLDIMTDNTGRIWIAGVTDSLDAQLTRPVQDRPAGSDDAYIAGFSGDGGLLFATYLGGTQVDNANGIGSDAAGRIYVGGRTDSVDFPTVQPLQSASGGSSDAFVARLNLEANTPPVADAGDDQLVLATAFRNCRAFVFLDGSRSRDGDGDQLTFAWTGVFGSEEGQNPLVKLGVGTHVISLTVSDGQGGTATDTVTVTVNDDATPVVDSAAASPSSLWPPNHRMVNVTTSGAPPTPAIRPSRVRSSRSRATSRSTARTMEIQARTGKSLGR